MHRFLQTGVGLRQCDWACLLRRHGHSWTEQLWRPTSTRSACCGPLACWRADARIFRLCPREVAAYPLAWLRSWM